MILQGQIQRNFTEILWFCSGGFREISQKSNDSAEADSEGVRGVQSDPRPPFTQNFIYMGISLYSW